MEITFYRDWRAIDASGEEAKSVTIKAGTYAVERIENPCGHSNAPWLVLAGTKIGAGEGFWNSWRNTKAIDWGVFEVIIEE